MHNVVVQLSGLGGLIGASYDMKDKGLFCTFVQRWHADTHAFHLSIREMTITLDDVSYLLHLSTVGQLCTYLTLEAIRATKLLVESLRVDRGAATTKTRHC